MRRGALTPPLAGTERVPATPTACLLILHGLAEHSGRYEPMMVEFAASGLACFAYDHRGHGRSPGRRGDIGRFSEFVDDFRNVSARISRRFPALPVFVWAHSLGSLVVIQAAADPSSILAGVITTGCPLLAPPPITRVGWALVRALAALVPTLRVSPRLPVDGLTHVSKVKEDYVNDPLVQEKVTVRLIAETCLACNRCLRAAPGISTRWLAVHGGDDPIAPPRGSELLVESLASSDKQLVIYPGLFHEVHNEAEPAASRFRHLVINWIRDRTVGADR